MNQQVVKKKLLIILPSIIRGGAEEYALTVGSAATQHGYEVHAAFPMVQGTASLFTDFKNNKVLCHQVIAPSSHRNFLVQAVHLIFQIGSISFQLLTIKPDIVMIILPFPDQCLSSIIATAFFKMPTVVNFQLIPPEYRQNNYWKFKLYNWARRRSQQWVVISENNKHLLSSAYKVPLEEFVCIFNGSKIINTRRMPQIEELPLLREKVRDQLGISRSSRILLTVGRLHSQKGYDILIPIIPHIIKEFPEVHFVWAGDGEQRNHLLKRVQEYGVENNVLFLGHRTDVLHLMLTADLFVFPTLYEGGQSFVITEAMACGLPIITTSTSGIPEVIEHGVHGLLCRAGDSCDLLEVVRTALRNPDHMKLMAQKAISRVQYFSEERMVQEIIALLKTMTMHNKRDCTGV